ncbi:hypothetical protein Ancab_015042 [Ancistrocladus abbreviatus]
MAGSLGNLYDSVESLSNDYIQPTFHKDSLLKPSLSPCKADIVPLLSTAQAPIRSLGYDNGFVKGLVNYMIMDDLVVKPMSTVSSITLLNQFNINDVSFLEEKVVHLGLREGVALLKASLESKTVLTDVFLAKKFSKYVTPAKEEVIHTNGS